MINAYGPTETTVCATMSAPLGDGAGADRRPRSGACASMCSMPGLEPVPVGVTGELYVAGAGLARGYLNRPGLTAERLPSPIPMARRAAACIAPATWRAGAPTGVLDYLGRADQQVKIRGFRIEPGEIEAALTAQPGIAQAAIIARDDGPGGKYLAAYFVPEPGTTPDPSALRRALAERLPDHMIPSAFIPLNTLPLSPTGKLDRAALPDPGTMDREPGARRAPDLDRVPFLPKSGRASCG